MLLALAGGRAQHVPSPAPDVFVSSFSEDQENVVFLPFFSVTSRSLAVLYSPGAYLSTSSRAASSCSHCGHLRIRLFASSISCLSKKR